MNRHKVNLAPGAFYRWLQLYANKIILADDPVRIDRLNNAWTLATQRCEFYSSLINGKKVPSRFSSWAEYAEKMPVTEKSSVVLDPSSYFYTNLPRGCNWSRTGGTTATPLRFPVTNKDQRNAARREWLLRRQVGLGVFDKQLKVWGHTHIFGNGFKAKITRQIKDATMGIIRESAYDLSPVRALMILRRIQAERPGFILSYSRVFEILAGHINANGGGKFDFSFLKALVATSEMFSSVEAEAEVSKQFGVPIFMEYGSAETGSVAIRDEQGLYQPILGDYFMEAQVIADGTKRLLITALNPRPFPLFRYAIGDFIEGVDCESNISDFKKIVGRVNEVITLPDGRLVHSEALTHAVRGVPGVKQYQYVIKYKGRLEIILIGNNILATTVSHSLAQLGLGIGDFDLNTKGPLRQSPAGKNPIVFKEDNS